MENVSCVVALLAAVSAVATPSLAGIADSPLPVLVAGKKTYHVYSVPGVRESYGLGTFFSCTSMDTIAMQVGVELFGSGGGGGCDVPATSLSVSPGATVTFCTNVVSAVLYNSLLACGDVQGSARILATSTKLTCTAFVTDPFNQPPSVAWQLTIDKKLTQKGD
jgi:hypothetical protein